MEIPQVVAVGAVRYQVVVDEAEINQLAVDAKVDVTAVCCRREQRIVLRPGLGPDIEAQVLLHEVLHAATAAAGLDDRLGQDEEEDVVNSLAPVLLLVCRQNPQLLAYLVGGD